MPWWSLAKELSVENEFILVSGNEISPVDVDEKDPRGHVGCIPRTLSDDFDTDSPFIDRPRGEVSSADAIQQALDRGCFAILNHPYSVVQHINADWTSFDYEGMEVWSGGANSLDTFDIYGWDAWRCDLLAGRKVTPIAASDNHRVHHEGDLFNPPLGRPYTAVYSVDRTWESIIDGLDAGMVALMEGESQVLLNTYDAKGQHAEDSSARYIRARGHVDARARYGATLRVTRAVSCDDPRPRTDAFPEVEDELLLELKIEGGEDFDHHIEIPGEPGVYTATLFSARVRPIGDSPWSAMSRGIVIR